MIPRVLAFTVAILIVSACVSTSTLQSNTSGAVGCAPDTIVISDESTTTTPWTWTATCSGKRFFCTQVNPSETTQCKEAQPAQ